MAHAAQNAYRQERYDLVQRLIAKGALRSKTVARAFAAVPRHAFLPAELAAHAYRDVPLILRREDGRPFVTAVAPSQLARVLEALDFAPGQSVLSVGGETGYAAALMSVLTGPSGDVRVLERDAHAARYVRARMKTFDRSVEVEAQRAFVPDCASPARTSGVDRILVHTALADIPAAWDERVPVGGRIALPFSLISPLQRLIAVWERHDPGWRVVAWLDGRAPASDAPDGFRLPEPSEVRAGVRVAAPMLDLEGASLAWEAAAAAAGDRCAVPLRGRVSAVEWRGLKFWLALSLGGHLFMTHPPDLMGAIRGRRHGAVVGRDGTIHTWGRRAPSDRLEWAIEEWDRAGRPPIERFRVTAHLRRHPTEHWKPSDRPSDWIERLGPAAWRFIRGQHTFDVRLGHPQLKRTRYRKN